MIIDYNRRRVIEQQKFRCRDKIDIHKRNAILQGIISVICIAGGIYASQKKRIVVPLVMVPTAATACSKLTEHEIKRRRYKQILESLERN